VGLFWCTRAILVLSPSWRHRWLTWDTEVLEPGFVGWKVSVLTTGPRSLCTVILYRGRGYCCATSTYNHLPSSQIQRSLVPSIHQRIWRRCSLSLMSRNQWTSPFRMLASSTRSRSPPVSRQCCLAANHDFPLSKNTLMQIPFRKWQPDVLDWPAQRTSRCHDDSNNYTVSTKKQAESIFAITLKIVYRFSSNLTGSYNNQCSAVSVKTTHLTWRVYIYTTL